jgi:hypothetical protein
MLEPKETCRIRQSLMVGGDAMAALKEGSEQQGDLADITSSDSAVCTGCLTC